MNSLAPDALALEVDEGVLVLHPERRRREPEPLVDEVLAEVVLAREAHRAELAVHPPGEPAVRVDPAAEPVARLEDRDPVAGLLEQQPGGQAGDPGADDDDVAGRALARREPAAQDVEEVDPCSHGVRVRDAAPGSCGDPGWHTIGRRHAHRLVPGARP